MHTDSKSFLSFDNTRLVYREWLADKPKGNIVVVHGAGEHSNRYTHVVDHFTAAGFNVFTWDARGHGESEGQRGFVERWFHFRNDIHYYFKAVRPSFSGQPVFLLGHSLGGVMTLDYLLNHPEEDIRGYICSAPAIGKVGISPILLGLSRIFTHIAPRLSLDTGLELDAVSRDPTWLESSRQDPLYHSKGTPRLATEVIDTAAWIHEHASDFNYPLLMVHGTDDRVCEIDGSRQFFGNTQQADKTLKEYEGGYHELFNDIDKARVLQDVQSWIDTRL